MFNVFIKLNNLIQQDNRLKKIIFYSFYVSIISFAILLFFAKSNNLNLGTVTGDSKVYVRMAENIAYRGIFSNSTTSPYVEESFRSPGYSFFMAVLISIFKNWDLALFVQALIVFISPVLFYLIFRNFNEKVAYISSLIFIFEPTKIFLSNIFLSDAIFLVIFFLSILGLLKWSKSFSIYPLLFSGLMLGIATMIRTITQFLPFVFILFIIFISWKKLKLKIVTRDIILFFLMFFVVVSPWMFRNYQVFGEFSIASLGKFNVVYYNAIGYLRQVHGNDSKEVKDALAILQTDPGIYGVRSLENIDRFNKITKDVISNNLLGYTKFHLVKTIPFFFSDGLRDVARYMKIISDTPPNISGGIFSGDFSKIIKFIKNSGPDLFLFIIGAGFWGLVFIFGNLGAIWLLKTKTNDRIFILLFIVLIAYFAILTGPVSNARYRFPVSPFLIFFAVNGAMIFISKIKLRSEINQS